MALTGAETRSCRQQCRGAGLAVGLAGRGGLASQRGELLEIGGGVRIPDIISRAGARLVEVGDRRTGRAWPTSPARWPRARLRADAHRSEGTAAVQLVLRVHQSNVRLTGFTEAPDISPG